MQLTFKNNSDEYLVLCVFFLVDTLFTVDKTGDIVKAMTNTNPCTKVAMWPCSDPNGKMFA